jgi:hypothetical protein
MLVLNMAMKVDEGRKLAFDRTVKLSKRRKEALGPLHSSDGSGCMLNL